MGEEMGWAVLFLNKNSFQATHEATHCQHETRELHKYMWSYQKHQSASNSFQQHLKYSGSVRHDASCRHDFTVSYSQLKQVSWSRLSNISTI